MDETGVGRSLDPSGRSERLESWKVIAAYLGRGVTTVQRWEQQEGLPVHRLPHSRKGSVFAIRSELDTWRSTRAQLGPMHSTVVPDELPLATHAEGADPRRPKRFSHRSLFLIPLCVAVAVLALTQSLRRTNSGAAMSVARSVVPQPLANDAGDERCPSLSPDGRQVVYYWSRDAEPGLYIKSVSGGPSHRLAIGDIGRLIDCAYPKWSPAGDLIAFLSHDDAGARNLWVVSSAGGRPRRVTSALGIDLSWAPDGQSLAFVDRASPGEPFSIFSVDLHGGARTRLTTPPAGAFGDTHCALSPDGRRLAIVRYANRHQSDLFVTKVDDSDRGGLQRLTTGFSGAEGIEWSPDGQLIVFGSHLGLWRVSVSDPSHQATRIVAFSGGATSPTFSRAAAAGSAHRLAYESQITDVNLWRWDIAERHAKKLAASTWWEDFPSVAPDGRQLAFASNRTGANEIWTVDAEGSDPRQLTFHRGPVVTAPQWSPDGTRLAFSSQVGGNRDIYVIRSDGSESTRITTGPSEEGNPSWSRDGRWLYFRSDQGGTGQIWKVAVSGGAPIQVTTGEASQAFESFDGKVLYFVRNAAVPGVWSIPLNGSRDSQESLVVPDAREGFWGVADKGIYFVNPPLTTVPAATTLKYFDFASRTVSTLAVPPGLWRKLLPGFSVSRDGRFVVWTQLDNAIRDLMLIDPWGP